MKLLLKIIAAPVIVALTLFVWICSAVLYCSANVLGLAGSLLGLLAILVIVLDSVKNGLMLLLAADQSTRLADGSSMAAGARAGSPVCNYGCGGVIRSIEFCRTRGLFSSGLNIMVNKNGSGTLDGS